MRRILQISLILMLAVLGLCPGLRAQSVTQSISWPFSPTVTFNNTTAAGNTYVLMASGDYMNGGRFTALPNDTEGNTWTKLVDTVSPNNKVEQVIWQALNVKGGTKDAITISTNGCCSTNIVLVEIHGAPYLDQVAQQGNTSTAANGSTSPAVSTAVANELLLGFGSTSPANGSGFTGTQAGYTSISSGVQYTGYKVVNSIQNGISAMGTVVSGVDNDSLMAVVTYAPNSPFPVAPAITSTSSASFTVSTAGSFTVTATGYPTPALSESGTLPNGLSFNTSTGVLSGTPAMNTAGSYPVTFSATNAAGTANQSFTIVVNVVPTFVQGTDEDDTPATFTQTTIPGDTYVFIVSLDYMNGGRFTGLPTDTEGNTCWQKIYDTVTPDNKMEQAVYQCIGVIGGTKDSILPTTNGPYSHNAELIELHNAGYLDQVTQQANSTAGSVYSPAITTTQPDEVIFVVGSTSPANGAGWQNIVQTGYTEVAIGSQYGAWEAVNSIQSNISGTAQIVSGIDNDSIMAIVSYAATAPGGTPAIITANNATFPAGTANSFTVSATGAPAPVLSESGTLPSGVTFTASTGKLAGTPSSASGGTYPITFSAQNSSGTAVQNFTLTVTQPPVFTSANNTTFSIGTAGSFTVTASGSPTPTYSETGTLPSGVSFTAAGALSGTPASGSAGTYPITITAQNGIGSNATQSFTLTVNQAPAITSANSVQFVETASGTFTVMATGSPLPTLSESGPLPSGVSFNTSTGALSGTPAAGTAGTYPLTFTASNGIGTAATQTFTLKVLSESPAITSANNASFTTGTAGSFTVTATGMPVPTLSESGSLPAGVTFNASTGVLGGTPVGAAGYYPITFSAQNSVGPTATQSFTLIVNQAPLNPNFVQFKSWALSSTVTFNNTTAAGNTYVLMASGDYMNGGRFTGLPHDTEGNTWTKLVDTVSPNSKLEQIVWQAQNVKGGTNDAVTISTNGCCSTNMILVELHNAAYLDQYAQQGSTSTATNGATSPAVTTTVSNEIMLGFGSTSPANGAGFSLPVEPGYTGMAVGVQYGAYQNVTSIQNGAAATGTVVNGGDNDSLIAIVTYAAASPSSPPAILSANSTSFVVGTSGSFTVAATGTPLPSISESGTLPTGVTFNSATGVLSGTPAAGTAGSYPINFTAQNGVGLNATQNFTLIVNQPPAITSANSTTFTVGTNGSFSATASGSPAPTFSETGTLPNGVTLATSGVLSGAPASGSGGTYSFTITASSGVGTSATQSFTLTVNQAPTITNANNATFTVGTAGSFSVTATATPAATFSETGALPSGVTFTSGGLLSGTPAAGTSGTYPITITAQNGIGANATQSFILTVNQAPAITSANNTTFSAGVAGSFTVTGSGSPSPTFSETGTLPSGVTFNASGSLSGTPATGTGGSYAITITATNGVGSNATQSFTLTVNQAPAISSANTASFAQGGSNTFTVTATATPAATFSETGALPSGVTLTTAGVLSGTPAIGTVGNYPITITASNGVGSNATQSFTLVVDQAAAITSANSAAFLAGTPGSFTVTITGVPTPTLTESGALPSGITFNASTGALGGTASSGGVYPLTFNAQNGIGTGATQNFTLTISQAPAITSASGTSFTVGTAGSFTATAIGTPAVTFSQTGTLPSGITFTTAGVLSGTPASGTSGSYPITITAQNGIGSNATQSFTLTVNQVPAITSANNTTFMVGTAGSFPVTATGSPAPTLSESGSLPPGVSFNTSTGVLSGTPAVGGSYPITITAQNGVGSNATQNFTLTVNQAPAIASSSSVTFTVATPGSFTVTITGSPTPTLSESGTLPTGLTFNATTGTLSGTPGTGTGGTYPLSFTAQNGVGSAATQSFVLFVNQPPVSPNIVQTKSWTLSSTVMFNNVTSAGNTYVLMASGDYMNGGRFTGLPHDTEGNTWVKLVDTVSPNNKLEQIVWQALNAKGGTNDAITISTNACCSTNMILVEVHNANYLDQVAQQGNINAGTNSSVSPAVTTTVPTEVILGFGSTSPANGSGFSLPVQTGYTGIAIGTQYAAYQTTAAIQNGATTTGSVVSGSDNDSLMAILTYASGSPTTPPTIVTANSTSFVVGTSGSFTVIASGTPAPTLSETGTLPVGVSFNSTTGVLSGTPAAGTSGSYPVNFTAQNGVGGGTTQSFTLSVNQIAAITSTNNATFTVGTTASFTVTTTGSPTPTVSVAGTLPSGVTFNSSTGTLSGTPVSGSGGSYALTVTAQNGVGSGATQTFTLTVNQTPTITSTNNATFTVGAAGSFTVAATATPSATFAETGALPSGVTFTTGGVLSGTPAANMTGSYPITISAQNGIGGGVTQSFTLTVNQTPAITSANSTTFTAGTAGSFAVTGTGVPAPTFSESGALPSGVTFNTTTGTLSGTLATGTGGTYPLAISAQNGVGGGATQNFTLTVNQAPAITSATSATFSIGASGSFNAIATGVPSVTFSETGPLPSGVTFTTAGLLSGTPAAGTVGTYPITIAASNGIGSNATQSFTLTVNQAAAITSANSTTFIAGASGSFTVTATGVPTPTLSASGTLPAGVNFNTTTGVLSGTPTTGGVYPITFSAQNGLGSGATQNFTLTVNQAPSITSASSTTFTVSTAGSFTFTSLGYPAPTFTESGLLPSGMSFNGGVLSGTPATGTVGSYPINISAQNGIGVNSTQSFMLAVNQITSITSANNTTFTVGTAGSFTVTAIGSPAPTISEFGNLPSGVTFNPATGVLSGTPAAGTGGVYGISFTAQNGAGSNATQNFTLTVNQAPAITSASTATFTVATAETFTVNATGYPSPTITYTGNLPVGVSLSLSGVLQGSSSVAGSFPISVSAQNGIGTAAAQSFTLVVSGGAASPTVVQSRSWVLSSTVTFNNTTTAGNTYVLMVSGDYMNGGRFTGLPHDTEGNTWTKLVDTVSTNNKVEQVVYQALNVKGGTTDAITVSTNACCSTNMILVEAHNAAYLDQAAQQASTSTATSGAASPAITTTIPNELIFGFGSTSPANGAGYSLPTQAGFTGIAVGSQYGDYETVNSIQSNMSATGTVVSGVDNDSINAIVTYASALPGVAPAITSANSTTFTSGTTGSFSVTATGNPTPTFYAIGTLPSGVTLDPIAGTLTGAPAAGTGGVYHPTIVAQNGVGSGSQQSFILTVNQSPVITSASSATFTVGNISSFSVSASGLPTPTLSTSGTLPSGIAFNPATGVLSGTPAAGSTGSYPLTFTAQNGIGSNATQSFTLVVNQAPTITSTSSTTFVAGASGSFTVTASGVPAATITESGTLPSGITFNTSTRVLSGTPASTTGGTYSITFIAQNGVGTNATQSFTLNVNQAPAITSTNAATFTVGTVGSFTFTATGNPAPTFYTVGTLPSGITLSSAGVLSGSPAAGISGTYLLSVTAQNGVGSNATQSFILTINEPPAITSASSVTFAVGTAGSFAVTASGNPAPTFSEVGALPNGVTLAAAGFLTGTPAAGTAGSYPITISAQNGIGTAATQSFTLTVNQAPATTSTASTTFLVGTAGTFTATASGTPAPTFSETGALPSGVTLTSAGILSGTPASGTAGSYPVTITAQNGVGANATQSFTLTVNQAPAITSATSTAFAVGAANTFTVTATGTPAPTFSETGALPSGVTFTTGGVLSGTPAANTMGNYPITITAQNGVGANATQSFTLTINQAPSITSAAAATFTVGTAGTFTVTATGTPTPTYSESGALPSGISFNTTTGMLNGTPAAATGGSYAITFTAQNGVGSAATQNFTLTIDQAPAFSSLPSTTFTVGTVGSFTVSATGNPAPAYSESGTLPSGVAFNAANGVLSGTPAAATGGNYPITFTAQNGIGTPATQTFALVVNQPPAITSGNAATFTVGSANTFTVTSTGSPASTFTESGPLPAGVTLSAAGALSGSPASGSSGTYPIVITAQNGVGTGATQGFTLTVNQAAAITSANTAVFGIGTSGSFNVVVVGAPAPTLNEIGALPSGLTFNASTGVISGISAASTAGNYAITFSAHNGVGADAVQSFTLVVGQFATITSANAATFSIGAQGSFTVTDAGAPTPTLSESGALPSGLTFNPSTGLLSGTPAAATTGTYPITFTAHNGIGADAVQNFTLTVGSGSNAPSINSPNSISFIAGTAGSFMVTATGSPTPTLSASGTLPSGVTFNTLTGVLGGTPALGTLGSYPITFTAQNGVGTNVTQTFTLNVNSAPVVATQPASQTVSAGQTATFMVSVTGSAPLTYQWQANGVNISNTNSSSYTTPAAASTDNATQYSVVVSNPLGSVISNAATLTVNSAPVISSPVANQTVATGQTGTFNVAVSVTGNLPVTYQWYKNNSSISGATSSSYTTPVTSAGDSGGQFTATVSNSLGNVTSNAATLTVVTRPSPATYYVDFASGSDQNSGLSKNSPWQYAPGMQSCSANCALFGLQPGDQVIFKGGVTWDATGFPMSVTASGNNATPIYFGVDKTWFAGNTWSQPVFDLTNSTWYFPPILTTSASYVTFDNLEIENEEVDNSGSWPPRSSITVNGGSNVTIQNCYIHGWSIQNPFPGSDSAPTGGIAFYNGATNGTVQNCVLDGSPESDSGVGIYGGTSIHGNVIENTPNGIIVNDPTAIVSGNQVFDVLYSVDPSESSNAIFATTSASIYNNIVHDLAPAASALYLEAGTSSVGNTQYVYNNIVWNVSDTAPVVIAANVLGPNSTSNQFIYNNTLVGGTAAGCVGAKPNIFLPNNLTIESNQCISELPASQAWCWNQAGGNFGCGSVINVTFGNNVLMTTETAAAQGYAIANSFQPTAGTNATVGAGLNLVSNCVTVGSALCSDLLGVGRPGSAAWDAGAYQYQAVAANVAPTITAQPTRQEVVAGNSATFSVTAAGTGPLGYQWMRNGVAISGATAATYTTPATAATDDGALFGVIVSNSLGGVTSSPAILSVSANPGQLTLSSNTLSFGTITVGSAATASVTLTDSSNDYISIAGISVSGSGFTVSGVPTGLILAPGETATLNVVFTPATTGSTAGTVTINSDASGATATVALSGAGIVLPHSASLNWSASPSSVFGYYVYRATNAAGPFTKLNTAPINATQYTDLTVQLGQTYYYTTTAVDADTLESPSSNTVTAVIPAI